VSSRLDDSKEHTPSFVKDLEDRITLVETENFRLRAELQDAQQSDKLLADEEAKIGINNLSPKTLLR